MYPFFLFYYSNCSLQSRKGLKGKGKGSLSVTRVRRHIGTYLLDVCVCVWGGFVCVRIGELTFGVLPSLKTKIISEDTGVKTLLIDRMSFTDCRYPTYSVTYVVYRRTFQV